MQITFENKFPDEKSTEKIINKIKETKDCNNKSDNKDLNHDLKNQEVEELIRVMNAKGVISTNTLRMIYLKEYVNNKLIKLIEIKPLSKPSSEKTFKLESCVVIILFNLKINSEKLILHLKIFSPTSLIAREIRELIFIICSIIKYDELDKSAKINNLKRN